MTRFVVVLTLALLAYNGAVSFLPAYPVLYVPLNVTAAVLVLFAGRRAGLTFGEVGLRRSTVGRGVAWGAAFAGVVVLGIAVAAAVPGLRFMLDDARVAGIGIGLLAYRTLLRIPFGTVLLEELAFRGVLFAAWTRVHGVVRAAVGSSIVFGVWHVRPAIELLDTNGLAGGSAGRIGAVVAAVVFTAGAGVLFCWLRVRSQSLVAPLVAHAAINSLATVAAFAVQ
jgi:membrane protease YdiL (CAAX protease family)